MSDSSRLVQTIADALAQPFHSVPYELTRRIRERFPGRFLLPTESPYCDVLGFLRAGRCEGEPWPGMVEQLRYEWRGEVDVSTEIGAWSLRWSPPGGEEALALDHVTITWPGQSCSQEISYVVADTQQAAESFFAAVCTWSTTLDQEVLVFDGGQWGKSRSLYQEIRTSHLEDLVLPVDRKEEMVADLQRFLDRRAEFAKYRVPWKRGVLLAGPPGNGKTMTVKVLANTLRVTEPCGSSKPIDCLYVRSLVHRHLPDHFTIGTVFGQARRSAPCLLIFEDIDSLVTDQNRSVFLNELDGLAVNDGILTIASTNHPERLDPALRDRPSRFDRTWNFDLPEAPERKRYLASWQKRFSAEIALTTDECGELASRTAGFSFAYLKELMVSSLMRWIEEHEIDSSLRWAAVASRQVDLLRAQMRVQDCDPQEEEPDDPET